MALRREIFPTGGDGLTATKGSRAFRDEGGVTEVRLNH